MRVACWTVASLVLLGAALPAQAQVSALRGAYAFSVGSANGVFVTGSFLADGAGGLTSGLLDSATSSGVSQSVTFTGSYTLGADGRGQMTLHDQLSRTLVLAFVLEAGDHGQLIWFDGTTDASGSFDRQETSSSPSGTFVFNLSGVDGNLCPVAFVGRLVADGSGKVSAGLTDYDVCGSLSPGTQAFTGTYTAPATGGRGTLTLSLGGASLDFTYYTVSASKLLLLERDYTYYLSGGAAEKQQAASFSNATLSGNYAFWTSGLDQAGRIMEIGQFAADGGGALTGQVDENDSGVPLPLLSQSLSGTYSVTDGTTGRGTATLGLPIGASPHVFYLVSPSRAFVIASSASLVTSGELRAQTGRPLPASTLSGRYGYQLSGADAAGVTNGAIDRSGQFTADGASAVLGNEDWNAPPITPFTLALGSGSVYSVDASGHGSLTLVSTSGSNAFSFYFVTPSQLLMLGTVDGTQILVGEANKQP